MKQSHPLRNAARLLACSILTLGCISMAACGTNPFESNAYGPYGNGSERNVVVASSTDIQSLTPSGNFQYENFIVDPGVTLYVPSGTKIRCTGNFTVNGTIEVGPGAAGGLLAAFTGRPPGAGNSRAAASTGELTANSTDADPGQFGVALLTEQAAQLYHPGVFGGGGGAGSGTIATSGGGDNGGDGGGSFTVVTRGTVSVAGGIYADGKPGKDTGGGGGGAGGVLVIASRASINVAGVLAVRGGKGGDAKKNATTVVGGGGGGGGGIVHLVAPAVAPGNVLLDGGAGGFALATVAATVYRAGGGGGGGCGGDGGVGGVGTGNSAYAEFTRGGSGTAGQLVQTVADPTDLY